jgi:hypothetical protein
MRHDRDGEPRRTERRCNFVSETDKSVGDDRHRLNACSLQLYRIMETP